MNKPTTFDGPRPLKLTVDHFTALHDAGVLADSGHVELIEGVVIEMSPQRRAHSYIKNELTYRLRRALEALGSSYIAQSEPTVALPPHSAPEPDVVVTNDPRGTGYMPAASITLVIEVADSTVRYDVSTKRDLYAGAALPEYWVVDVQGAVVHRFWSPDDGHYRQADRLPLAEELRSGTMPELAIEGISIL
ncbi:hypothetical protein ASG67_09220 [Sphingomonas sp. Leaf339]|uniref:Uma2 family endonuclease n=1 Tax=Sphingomonas sp. Leaf339 TaxID=1736343 RepID=UPI0007009654|nr:Uma2 family endonuclease [Sphingomonas sp. Leaf339]KQU53025.1 hypothetical protein ASG67_09220 [Sphingomonas sp. Leaf339]